MKRKLLILFLTCVVGWLSPLNAQEETVTIGTGTSTYNRVPLYSSQSKSSSQLIYKKASINKEEGAVISAIAFYQTATNTYGGDVNIRVYMQNTDKETFASTSDFVSFTDSDLYFDGSIKILDAQEGWLNIQLDKNFTYDGEKNLLIGIQHYSGGTYGAASFRYTSTSNSELHNYGSNAYIRNNYLPNLQITFGSSELGVTVSAFDTDIYNDETTTLTANISGGTAPFTYSWSATTGSIEGEGKEVTFVPEAVGASTSVVTCTVKDNEGAEVSNTVTINVADAANKPKGEVGVDGESYSEIPGYNYYNYSISQQIYTKDEMNIPAGSYINSISFRLYSKDQDARNWSVYLLNTEKENFTSYNDYVSVTTDALFTGDVTFGNEGDWFKIDFTKDFVYEGNNILVCITDNKGSYNYGNTSNKYYGITTGVKTAILNYNDNYGYDVSAPTSSNGFSSSDKNKFEDFKNSVKFGYAAAPPFSLALSADKTVACKTDAVELSATVDGSGTYYYTWSVTEGSGEFSNATAATTNFTPSAAGNYVITCSVYDGTNTVEKTISLTVYDVPELTVSQNTFDIEANGTATIELTYSGTNTPNISDWSVVESTDNSEANKFVVTTTPLKEDTELTFTLYNYDSPYGEYDGAWGYLCAAEVTVTINVEEALYVELGAENDVTSICEDDANGIQLIATPKYAAGECTYIWTSETEGALEMLSATDIANPVFTPSAIDEGSLTVTYRCTVNDGVTEASETIDVTVYGKPELNISEFVTVNSGENLVIPCDSKNYSYSIDVEPTPYGTTYEYPNQESGDYSVWNVIIPVTEDSYFTVTAYNNYYGSCAVTKTVQVKVINENKEVEIGTDDQSLWNRYYLPVKTDANYTLTQQIYTASDLNINEASEITSVSFFTAVLSTRNARNIEIYVANTDLNNFVDGDPNQTGSASALSNDFVNMTGEPNFSGEVTFASGWTTITFTNPFHYELGKNVILTVNDKTGTTDYTNEYSHYSTSELRSIVMYNSSAAYDATDIAVEGSYTYYGNLFMNNHIKFAYQAIAQDELVAEINVGAAEICDGDNNNRFEMYATKVNNATYAWYKDGQLLGDYREFTYSNENPGTYTIKLVVTQNDVTAESTIDLTINQLPNTDVVMGSNGYGFVGEDIHFATTETHIEGTTYAIDLNVDGYHYNYSNVEYDTHNFEDDGTFYYTVTATLGKDAEFKGCDTKVTRSVTIYPKASFTAENACAGQEVVFVNTTYTPNIGAWNFGEGEGFVWNFGDGSEEVASNAETVTHTYAEADTYDVTLTVTKSGVSNEYFQQVIVYEIPTAEFTYEGEYALTDITFSATNAGNQATYTWNFGDETEGTGMTCTHQYATPGEYTVTLTVSQNGCTSTAEKTIIIEEKESGAAIVPEFIDLGSRPANAWTRPYTINITPDGNTPLTIETLEVEDYDDGYDVYELSHADLPVTLQPGDMFSVEVSMAYIEEGYDAELPFDILVNEEPVIGDGNNNTGTCIVYSAYDGEGDVYEFSHDIDVFAGETYIPQEIAVSSFYPNYLLPGVDVEVEYYDAVFKFTLDEAAKVTATVNGDNPVVYVYPEDFGGEPGPGLTNYVGYEPYVPTFEGFSFTLEDDPLFSQGAREGTGWKTGSNEGITSMEADIDIYTSARSFCSYQGYGTEDEMNYFITTDKYYISETAKLSMSTWISASNMKYYVFVSEDGSTFTSVHEDVLSSKTAITVEVDLSEYAGKEYYIGIMHVGAENSGVGGGNFYLDDITLYEPETRGTRASADGSLDIMLPAGTYYLVAAAENVDFSVTIGAEELLAPGLATNPSPIDKSVNVPATTEQLKWTFGENTEEYQLLFGTANPPTEVVVDWNSYIENASYDLSELEYALGNNTVYYWQVNARNVVGETEGTVWRFAKPFDAPQNLALSSTEINVGETSILTWDAVAPTTIIGYNIWAGSTILIAGSITECSYTIENLAYSADPYEILVEAIYMVDDLRITSRSSSSVELKVNAESIVEGYVYDATTSEPLEGATVTYGAVSFTTGADGYYSGSVLAGNYIAVARMSGYNKSEVLVNVVPSEDAYVQNFNLEPTMAMATNVVAKERDDTAVDVEWTFNAEGDPMFENFENGFKYEWTTSADYPWTVVEITGGIDETVNESVFGSYCAKSGNYNVGNSSSWIELSAFIPFDGKISFYYRISSEPYSNADMGNFYIDGVQQHIKMYDGDPYNCCFGSTLWQDGYSEFDVTAGTHTFKWEYTKDDGGNEGEDAFYIDNVSFYENTNVYKVYRQDILTETPELLAEGLIEETYADETWETIDDGIYQWGVSVIYNEPAGDLLNETFEEGTSLEGWSKTEATMEIAPWVVGKNGGQQNKISSYGGGSSVMSASGSPGAKCYIVTPEVNASRQPILEFDYIVPCWTDMPNDFNKFRVVCGETQEGPWTTVLMDYNEEAINDWTRATIELPLEKSLYIAFEHLTVENYGFGAGLDNVRIHREAVTGESEIAWSDRIIKGNELIVDGNWNVKENWSRGTVPTVEEVAVINAAGTVNSAVVAKTVLVNDGTLTIDETGVLTAQTVKNDDATKLTINAGGQLVHSNEGVMATFVKDIVAYADADINDGWYTISSPLASNIDASEVGGLLGGEFDLYRYDEPTHYWENYEDDTNEDWGDNGALIEKGRGYLYANSANTELSFAGELNVAEVTTSLSVQATKLIGLNLLGNPFAHDIYQGVAFDKDGNLAEAHYTLNNHGEWQATTKENPIKSGAGFLVQATDGADLTISKTNAQTRAAANAMLVVSVVNNVFEDVAYVSFNDGIGLEKIGHMNEYAPMVYIPGDFNNYAYATVEEDVTEVPVNFEAMTMGEYTIAVKAKNCEYKTMVLVDNLTGEETNLLKDSYTFMATTTDAPDRFVIKLAKDEEVEDSFIYINNGELIFDNLSSDAIINVFDVLGRNIATFNNCGDTTFRVSTDLFADGVYMVRVIEGNNVKVQKMVIE